MSFHYTLHGGLPGCWLVGWISMCMLVALISGVVVHKRIFKDFFTFRPGKEAQLAGRAQRHRRAGPAVSIHDRLHGLAFSYMPWPLHAYGDDAGAYRRYQAELAPAPAAPASRRRARPDFQTCIPCC